MRYWKVGVVFLIVAAVVAGGAWYFLLGARTVIVTTPTRGPAVQAVYATGTVEAKKMAGIGPEVTGRIVEILVEEGDGVKAGDVLLRLDEREAQARVNELEAKTRYLKSDLERARNLFARGHVSANARDLAESEFDAAQGALAVAREKLREHTLTAPFDGEVIRKDGELGEVVDKGDVLIWVGCCAPLRIEAEVDEEDIPMVALGQTALIRSDAWPERVFEGSVDEITPKGDPIARNYRVRIGLPVDSPLMIGMTSEVNVVVAQRENALLVPLDALDGKHVWIVENERLVRRAVRIGIVGTDTAEIIDGLTDDALVLLNPPERLSDGARVRTRMAVTE